MATYIIRRLLSLVPTLVFVSVVVFAMMHLIPGNAAAAFAGPGAPPAVIAALTKKMGLDKPIYIQYLIWLTQMLHGHWGTSIASGLPVISLIGPRLQATVELTIGAMISAIALSVPVGTFAALSHRQPIDRIISAVTSVGLSVPEYWSGLLAILLFSVTLHLMPSGGRVSPSNGVWLWLQSLAMPAITLGFPIACMQARFVRASMIEVMKEQYILTARSKGLSRKRVVVIHALRNALVPLMTVAGVQLGRMLGGALLVESVYSWPGIGRMVVNSIVQRDYALVQASVLLIVVMFALVNLITDLLYSVLDPRIVTAQG